MGVRIPLERHPYRQVERNLRLLCPDLALVLNHHHWKAEMAVWMIIQKGDFPVPTSKNLLGIPGLHGPYTKWMWVTTLWGRLGAGRTEVEALCPGEYHGEILWAIHEMDTTRFFSFGEFLDNVENMNEEARVHHMDTARSLCHDVTRHVCGRRGRIISTSVGTTNIDQMYDNSVPTRVDGRNKMENMKKCPPPHLTHS